ncbi:MAG: hypothetical protein QOF70_608 [Acetobacteraceae bacterium]|nr:hypothetical protein [Acetobacteraceae bacterium]
MIEPSATRSLQLKVLLRDVHPAVWRRVTLSDALSIADLHQAIQLLIMGWDGDHLHRFCIQGCEYCIAYASGLDFDEDAAAVPLSRFQFQPSPPDGCGGPQCYAEQCREVFSGGMADDMDTVVAVLRRVSERDPTVLDDPDERWDFERAVSRLEARRPFLSNGFERTVGDRPLIGGS